LGRVDLGDSAFDPVTGAEEVSFNKIPDAEGTVGPAMLGSGDLGARVLGGEFGGGTEVRRGETQ
jgi:hypothetical protein